METITKLTIVYDNNAFWNNLETDWGFSCLIESGNRKILFDAGQKGDILLNNMKKLEIDPMSIDAVFLSHRDHDHTGGLKDFLEINPNVKIYYPQSLPPELVEMFNKFGTSSFPIKEFTEILPGFFSLGELGSERPEQSLVMHSTKGLIIITGCSHPGIVQIVELAKRKFPNEQIYLVTGGFHFYKLNEEEINNRVQALYKLDILNIAPVHCTGLTARQMFSNVFDTGYIEAGAGKIINIY